MYESVSIFVESGRSPLRYVTCHAIQAVVIWPVSISSYSVETAIFGVVTSAGLEVSKQAAFCVSQVRTTPRIRSKLFAATCSVFPLLFCRQTEGVIDNFTL